MFTSLAIFWVLRRSSAVLRKALLKLRPVELTAERIQSWSQTGED